MLRTGQSLLANALIHLHLGRGQFYANEKASYILNFSLQNGENHPHPPTDRHPRPDIPATNRPRRVFPLSSSVNREPQDFDHSRNEMKPSGNPSGSLERQKARCGGDNGLRLCILGPCSSLSRSLVGGLRALLQSALPLAARGGSLGYSHDLVEDHFYASLT